ncbi:MAG TPA: hypothetical protein VE010_08725, partial [Thermoanaerobaculia bacterium]|nr:hypothetical protein [Thermoanaerobaculia bacterium]
LYGDDVLARLEIPRPALVRRLRQVLLTLTLRLRGSYIEHSLREEQCALTVAESAAPLRTAAASILELEGRGTLAPNVARETLVRELADARFAALLPHVSEARERRVLPAGQAAPMLLATLDLARALHERAHRLAP